MITHLFILHSTDPIVEDILLHASRYCPVMVTMVPPASGPSPGSKKVIDGFYSDKEEIKNTSYYATQKS